LPGPLGEKFHGSVIRDVRAAEDLATFIEMELHTILQENRPRHIAARGEGHGSAAQQGTFIDRLLNGSGFRRDAVSNRSEVVHIKVSRAQGTGRQHDDEKNS